MKYYCERCDRDVDDNGPYEDRNGDFHCQGCMEDIMSREIDIDDYLYEQHMERVRNDKLGNE